MSPRKTIKQIAFFQKPSKTLSFLLFLEVRAPKKDQKISKTKERKNDAKSERKGAEKERTGEKMEQIGFQKPTRKSEKCEKKGVRKSDVFFEIPGGIRGFRRTALI